ncbi:DNA-directed RNA polymerases IV and V subunit 3B-like [Curcuma longa]|uniref:DNA-directed RNA polymerases IV and V subunit 3B-like n=1 Tax=Curcuma longa TaxID=136217 RepID=UPI003D9E43D8
MPNGHLLQLLHINEELMETLTLEEKRAWVESSPTKVFGIDPNTQQVVVIDPEAMGKPGLIEIFVEEDSFIFTVESTDAIKASQMLVNVIEVQDEASDMNELTSHLGIQSM